MPLSDLIAALAAATGPSHALNERMATEVFGWKLYPGVPGCIDDNGVIRGLPRYTASLDAITGAVEQRWPGCVWTVENGNVYDEDMPHAEIQACDLPTVEGVAATAALCLCLAAARLALAEGGR